MALFKGSRYEKVSQFVPDDTGRVPFRGLRPRDIGSPEPALEHVIAQKNRLDGLGHHYYARSADWYRIAEANAGFIFPEDILHVIEPPIPAAATPVEDDALRDAFERDNGAERIGATILIPRREEPKP